MDKSLRTLRAEIAEQLSFINHKPYSHNIIGIILQQIASRFGIEEANQVIEDYNLEYFGWRKVTTNE